jgi:phage tail-like protein
MPTGSRDDPYAGHNFLVVIDGVTQAGFAECSGLSMESDAIEYRNGNEVTHVRKINGLSKYANIVLKRGFTADKNWRKKVIDGKTERASGSITLLDEARQPAIRWNFREAWPRKLDGPTLNAKTNDVAIETLELVVEQLEVE